MRLSQPAATREIACGRDGRDISRIVRQAIMLNDSHIWRGAQERLRQEMSSAQFETWLRGTQLRLDEDGAAELQVRTTFAKELLESRYRERIVSDIAGVT